MEFGIVMLLIGYIGSMGVLGALAIVFLACLAIWIVLGAFMLIEIHVIEPIEERRKAQREARKRAEHEELKKRREAERERVAGTKDET